MSACHSNKGMLVGIMRPNPNERSLDKNRKRVAYSYIRSIKIQTDVQRKYECMYAVMMRCVVVAFSAMHKILNVHVGLH